jgi:flagellar motility protein MotE (MotC chaperone)
MSVAPPPRRRRRSRQRWALTALGLVFAISALLRLGTLEGAFAEGDGGTDLPDRVAVAGPGPTPSMAAALQEALIEVEALRATLAEREMDLADRERAVATASALVEARLADLEAAETRLEGLIARSDSAAETDLDRLTRVYETMPPEEAAAVFEQMQPSFAAGFLTRMSPAASATLMAALPPEQAYAVSVVIATRNSTAPRLDDGPAGAETEN